MLKFPLIYASEQYNQRLMPDLPDEVKARLTEGKIAKSYRYKPDVICFELNSVDEQHTLNTNYLVGVDWVIKKKIALYIEPKINESIQVDFLGMLLSSLNSTEDPNHLSGLYYIEYDEPWIQIPVQRDILSPVLIVQFLQLLKTIVRKGLKKSYYRITENLSGRIKGKILVGSQIKENISKNRFTKTICSYQAHGVNTPENQFLKLVIEFVSSYIFQNKVCFTKEQGRKLKDSLNYCSAAFQQVDVLQNKHQPIHLKKNPFYREYDAAIKIGEFILKRFSFNLNKVGNKHTLTPPFWIDMSKLFELYVFGKLKREFPKEGELSYHDTYWGGKETDILIRAARYKCVIDCKYKPRYVDNAPSLDDKRQLAGYTRLKSVYRKLEVAQKEIIKGIIIFSSQDSPDYISKDDLFRNEIGEYVEFYKLGIRLPELIA